MLYDKVIPIGQSPLTLTNVGQSLDKIFDELFIAPQFNTTVIIDDATDTVDKTLLELNGNNHKWITYSGNHLGIGTHGYANSILQLGPKGSSTGALTSTVDINWTTGDPTPVKYTRWKTYGSPSDGYIQGYAGNGTTVVTKISAVGDSYFNVGNTGFGTNSPNSGAKIDVRGNIYAGTTSDAANRVIRVMSNSSYKSGFEAYGAEQGTGYLYVGQSTTHGGGILYNGDDSPDIPHTVDAVSFYRKSGGVDTEVFYYMHSSNNVTFNGTINATGISTSGVLSGGSISTTGILSAGSITTIGPLGAGNTTITGTLSVSGKASYINHASIDINNLNDITHKSYVDDEIAAHALGWWISGTTQTPTDKDVVVYNPTTTYKVGINKINPTYDLDVFGNAIISDSLDVDGVLNANNVLNVEYSIYGNSNFYLGTPTKNGDSIATITANDAYLAGLELYGNGQGFAYTYLGRDINYGGGIIFQSNGPSFPWAEDAMSFYRRHGSIGTNTEVFSYRYDSNTVNFRGDINVAGDVIAETYFKSSNQVAALSTASNGTIYIRPNSTTNESHFASSEIRLGATSTVIAGTLTTNGTVKSSSATAIFATASAGTVYLRPYGSGSSTSQSTFSTSTATINTDLRIGGSGNGIRIDEGNIHIGSDEETPTDGWLGFGDLAGGIPYVYINEPDDDDMGLHASNFEFYTSSGTSPHTTISSSTATFGGSMTVSGNLTVNGDTIFDTYLRSSDGAVVLGTSTSGTIYLRPAGYASGTDQSSFNTSTATIGTNMSVSGTITATSTITAPTLRATSSVYSLEGDISGGNLNNASRTILYNVVQGASYLINVNETFTSFGQTSAAFIVNIWRDANNYVKVDSNTIGGGGFGISSTGSSTVNVDVVLTGIYTIDGQVIHWTALKLN